MKKNPANIIGLALGFAVFTSIWLPAMALGADERKVYRVPGSTMNQSNEKIQFGNLHTLKSSKKKSLTAKSIDYVENNPIRLPLTQQGVLNSVIESKFYQRLPDLFIEKITYGSNVNWDCGYRFFVVIRNNGMTDATAQVKFEFFELAGDGYKKRLQTQFKTANKQIGPKEQVEIWFEAPSNHDALDEKVFYSRMTVDPNQLVQEWNETNNVFSENCGA